MDAAMPQHKYITVPRQKEAKVGIIIKQNCCQFMDA